MNFVLNDRAVNFTLSDRLDFYLNDGPVNFKLNAENSANTFYRLLEDGFIRLLEDGSFRLLE